MLPRAPNSVVAPSRRSVAAALVLVLGATLALPAQMRGRGAPPTAHGSAGRGVPNRPGGEHLAQWMQRHSNLPLPEQQRALEHEPGFRELSPETQQRMRNRLSELNSMAPERRQRIIARTEAIEHLAPEQRQQIRGTMQQLSSLPQESRRSVSRAFREYRGLPADQRANALRSGQFTGTLNPEERSTFNSLVGVEPYLPPPASRTGAPQPTQPAVSSPGDPQNLPRNGFRPH